MMFVDDNSECSKPYKMILEHVPLAIQVVDCKFNIICWNKVASNILGYEYDDVVNKKKLWHLFKYDVHAQQAVKQLEERGQFEGETTLLRNDGSEIYTYLNIVKLPIDTAAMGVKDDSEPNSPHYVCYMHDTTQRKQMEKELHEYAIELEHKVSERTEALEFANEELQKLNRLKDEFVANVSHDLRTPLVSSQGYIELMLAEDMGSITEEQRRALTITQRNMRRLIFLIENLLSLSRLRYGRKRTAYKPFSFIDLAGECLRDLRVRTLKSNLTIRVEIPNGLPLVDAAEDDVYRVLNNLLSNSEKYTGNDPMIEISAKLISPQPGEEMLEVSVRDNGMGISPSKMPNIFDRYKKPEMVGGGESKRETASFTRMYGVGIGLPLVKEILSSYGCDIWINSEKSSGTEVIFQLPVLKESAGEQNDSGNDGGNT